MRRSLLLSALLLALGGASAHAQAPAGPAAKLTTCQGGSTPAERYAVFTGSMPAIEGSRRMAIKFELQQRISQAAGFQTVDVPKFGIWQRSRPNRAAFIYSKRVDNLLAPAAYRAVVRYRWYGARGKLLRSARRFTSACRQNDPRADLGIDKIQVLPGPDAETFRYRISLRNSGHAATGAFGVVLGFDGAQRAAQTVDDLGAGEKRFVELTAPRCAEGTTLQVRADPDGVVDESHEDDNVFQRPCPARPA